MADFTLDREKLEAFQKMVQSDPRALEKMMSQVTPDQVSAAMSLLGGMDPRTKGALGSLVSGLIPAATDGQQGKPSDQAPTHTRPGKSIS